MRNLRYCYYPRLSLNTFNDLIKNIFNISQINKILYLQVLVKKKKS